MTTIRFFPKGKGLPLSSLAELCGGALCDAADPDHLIDGLATLGEAGPRDIGFFDNLRYTEALALTAAGCVIVTKRNLPLVPAATVTMLVRDPGQAFALAGRALYPDAIQPTSMTGEASISPHALIDPSAVVEDGVTIEAFAVVGPAAGIGRGTIIGPGAVVAAGCQIGRDCRIGAHTTIQHAFIGNRVILHPGVRIGQDGFGYATGKSGILKSVQVGRVILQDDVEVGANSTIDRGAIRDTVIGENTKIDNQVQIGHNVRVGRNCLIVAHVGISGSATIGDGVAIGGQSGVNGHVTIGDGAQIAAVSTVAGDVPPRARWGGTPAKPVRDWFREMTWLSAAAKAGRMAGSGHDRRDDDA